MPAEVEPPELASLLDFAERPREGGWSLRAALVRYAQPQPGRVGRILELVRRIEFALHPHAKLVERQGQELWDALQAEASPSVEPDAFVVKLLRVTIELDRLGDGLAAWAVDVAGERPDGEVDTVTTAVARRLDELGVAREERQAPSRQRG